MKWIKTPKKFLFDYVRLMMSKVPDEFDWKFYIDHYPDLKKNGVDNKRKALIHWIRFGRTENRIYCSKDLINPKDEIKVNTMALLPLTKTKPSFSWFPKWLKNLYHTIPFLIHNFFLVSKLELQSFKKAKMARKYWRCIPLMLERKSKGLIYDKLTYGHYILKGEALYSKENVLEDKAWSVRIASDSPLDQGTSEKMNLSYSGRIKLSQYIDSCTECFSINFFLPYDCSSLRVEFIKQNWNDAIFLCHIQVIESKGFEDELIRAKRQFLRSEFSNQRNNSGQRSILIYGDINMNSIDGSSIWLNSIVKLVLNFGFKVFLLLKSNVKRDLLLEDLVSIENLVMLTPARMTFENDEFDPETAADVIEFLDGMIGGFDEIILRGLNVVKATTGKGRLSKRVLCYLTDVYTVDSVNGRSIIPTLHHEIGDIVYHSKYLLTQTSQLARYLHDELGIDNAKMKGLPPILPLDIQDMTNKSKSKKNLDNASSKIKIVYAGKLAQQWGIIELFEIFAKLRNKYDNLELHVIGDKISTNTPEYPRFQTDVQDFLETQKSVVWHKALSRRQTISLLKVMDIGWAYRDPQFEKKTLELSTKLLEYIAIGIPTIVVRNGINEKELGADYPFFVDDKIQIEPLLENLILSPSESKLNRKLSKRIVEFHRSDRIKRDYLLPLFIENSKKQIGEPKNVVIAAHDFKFISNFESYLCSYGHHVFRDEWEWGSLRDLTASKRALEMADIIFCEWGLANAVWYSYNKKKSQKLYVRIHLQEVNETARNFSAQLNIENVDRVIFVSDVVRRKAKSLWNWPDSKMCVIPNYVHAKNLYRPKLPTARFHIGMVGIVPQRKRFDRALDTIERLRQIDSRYKLKVKGKLPHEFPWMFGPGKKQELHYFEGQFKRIEENPLLKNGVEFDGYGKDMADWYRNIGVVVSPSDFESFHYSIADGAASGSLPIIWPWPDSNRIYPSDWVIENSDQAVKKIIAYNNLPDKQRLIQSDEYHRYINRTYHIDQIFDSLRKLIFDE